MKIYILIAKGETKTENLWVGTNKNKAVRDVSKVDFGEPFELCLQEWEDENLINENWL